MSDSITHDAAVRYAAALTDGRTDSLLAMLADSAQFQSPFTLWDDPAGVGAAYAARATAFTDLVVLEVVAQGDRAVLLWRADVSGRLVEGCEVLTLSRAEVLRVDVYLRPAAVLSDVHAAMKAAWPREPRRR